MYKRQTDHSLITCSDADIGACFPDVVWHAEMPVLRTSPAPMFLLSGLVRQHGFKVVLTGEGADEVLAGYNIFKEAKVRRFWARQPDSPWRPLLLHRLYPYVGTLGRSSDAYLRAFFGQGLAETESPHYSHFIRWRNTSRLWGLFSSSQRAAIGEYDPVAEFQTHLDGDFRRWSGLAQAQYIEITIFMSEYLLSSQGDRMTAAHSVEGRYPFLDHRVLEFCAQLPPYLKLRGLQEKYLLKRAVRDILPPIVWQRPKQPYRAPIGESFFGGPEGDPQPYVEEMLSAEQVQETGYFDPRKVDLLVRKAHRQRLGEVDQMAVAGVLSVQLLDHLFGRGFRPRSGDDLSPMKIVREQAQSCFLREPCRTRSPRR